MQPHKAIHICNSHQPTHKPKIAKEYVFAVTDKQGRKISTCGNIGLASVGQTVHIEIFVISAIGSGMLTGKVLLKPARKP